MSDELNAEIARLYRKNAELEAELRAVRRVRDALIDKQQAPESKPRTCPACGTTYSGVK